ncbi:hypothetical protein [Vibrio owensii]|uniref:hypothetical protein n=1 Tax=Vibrio harveyi group TaxID=717610 RepID=UPI003CC59CD3
MRLIGKRIELLDGAGHKYEGHYGFIIDECVEDDEYHVAGGSISTLNPDGTITGPIPVFCRNDFKIPRLRSPSRFDKEDRIAYELWLEAKEGK